MDELTDEERIANLRFERDMHGRSHPGFDFFPDLGRPGPYKRYRGFIERLVDSAGKGYPEGSVPHNIAHLLLYSLLGYEHGIRYVIHYEQTTGMTKSQVLEILSIVFIWAGPRGMETCANALKDYVWVEPQKRFVFPQSWPANPAVLESGFDFSTVGVTRDELAKVENWYMTYEGEVPAHVRFLLRHDPAVLKAYRDRLEHTVNALPIKLLPFAFIMLNVQRGFAPGLREGLCLGRGFGLSIGEAVRAACWGTVFGGVESLALLEQVGAEELFANWSKTSVA